MNRARPSVRSAWGRRGSTLMMTLVYVLLFASLASSMVAFSQGNVMVQQNDTDTKIALMAAESGMSFLLQKMESAPMPTIKEGSIANMVSPYTATTLWSGTNVEGIAGNNGIGASLASVLNTSGAWASGVTGAPTPTGTATLTTSAITLDPTSGSAKFTLSVAWDSGNPFTIAGTGTSVAKLHLSSVGQSNLVSRTVTMDLWIQKKLNYAVYSNVAIQLGKNVHVIGDVASTYNGTGKGPPIQMFSDYHYLPNSGNLDSTLATFRGLLSTYDSSHVNRLDLGNSAAASAAKTAGLKDMDGDGFIDDSDIALQAFGTKVNPSSPDPWGITKANFTNPITGKLYDSDLFTLIDSPMGSVTTVPWTGYGDNVIDYHDPTAKVTGNLKMALPYSTWQSAASGWQQYGDTTGGTTGKNFNDQFEGTIASTDANPVQFGVDFSGQQTLSPSNFDTTAYTAKSGPSAGATSGSIASGSISDVSLTAAMANGGTIKEQFPSNVSSGYQATYSRPVFQNVNFNNVRIPKGLNAKFINCTFNGYTNVQLNTNITSPGTSTTTTDPSVGNSWAQQVTNGGTFSPDGITTTTTTTTGTGSHKKTTTTTTTDPLDATNSVAFTDGNNLHFSGCTFNGPLTSDNPTAYTHFADSWEFDSYTNASNVTTNTAFNNTVDPTVTILAPNTNIEIGGFTNPGGNPSTLVGVVVAGNIDIRGSTNVDGSLIVTGLGAGNTTLGYFGSTDSGQAVPPISQLPTQANGGYGHLYFQLNTNRGMPNGIAIPVVASAQYATYQIQ